MNDRISCPTCKGAGMIACGTAVQYCMCATGRTLKAQWMKQPADLREAEEAISPTIPDQEDLRRAG